MSAQEKHGIREENGGFAGLSHRARAFITLVEKAGLKRRVGL